MPWTDLSFKGIEMKGEGAQKFSETTEQKVFLRVTSNSLYLSNCSKQLPGIQKDISWSNNYSNYLLFDSVNMFRTSKENNQLILSWCQYHIQLNETYKIGKQESIGNELAKLQKFRNVSFISILQHDCISFVNILLNFSISFSF